MPFCFQVTIGDLKLLDAGFVEFPALINEEKLTVKPDNQDPAVTIAVAVVAVLLVLAGAGIVLGWCYKRRQKKAEDSLYAC